MSREADDYQMDVRFGEWLREQRVRLGLTLEGAAQAAALKAERLKALEIGYSDRGITRSEAERICAVYQISLDDCLQRAVTG